MTGETGQNDQLVLISGESTSGKSASLKDIKDQDKWFYLNCEAGKRLPFRNKFVPLRVEDPYQVFEAFDVATADPNVKGIVIDTLTFLMDMFETLYVRNAANGQKAWGDFADFFKVLMQQKVVAFGRPVIILAHTRSELNEQAMAMHTAVPIKGSLKNNGVEAYFSTVVSTKKVPLKELSAYANPLLTVTEDDEILGYKHVFQTRLTKSTVGERIRTPMDLFSKEETFMDNNAALLLDRLNRFYAA